MSVGVTKKRLPEVSALTISAPQDKAREPYLPKSLNKLIGICKTLINGSGSFSIYKKGYLPKLDLSDLKLSAITDQKDKSGTRIEHNLQKEELDQLFWFEFNPKKIKQYQQIFDECNNSKSISITIEDLVTAPTSTNKVYFYGHIASTNS